MHALKGNLLLTAWDRCTTEHDLDRALTMLSLALPNSDRVQLAELSIAERNLLLLRLREISFGSRLKCFAACSQCGAALEFALSASSLIAGLQATPASDVIEWNDDDGQYMMRAVNTTDLIASLDSPNVEQAQEQLLARCLTILGSANPPSLRTLPAVTEAFEQLNAASEMSCVITCPDCSNAETLDLDVARFLWLEVRQAARRLFEQIHELASAYGWSEQIIARMTPQRREAYLEMLSL